MGAGGEEREPAAVTRPARGAPGHKHLRHLFRQERERKWQWPRTSPFQKWDDASGAFGNADVSRTTKVGWLSSGRREGGPQPSARNREVMKRTCFITQVGLAVRLPHPCSERGTGDATKDNQPRPPDPQTFLPPFAPLAKMSLNDRKVPRSAGLEHDPSQSLPMVLLRPHPQLK